MQNKLKIAITADPQLPVPPKLYGGIERIINMIIDIYIYQGHEVTLFAHKDSKANCKIIFYRGTNHSALSAITNSFIISKHLLTHNFDVIHSFGRLAYIVSTLPLKIPKLMSYQREPTISQVKKAILLARKNSLFFSGCSNYITDLMKPYTQAYTIYNGIPLNKFTNTATVSVDAPLVFLGRIEPIKGTHIAITLSQLTQKKLIIAGNITTEHQAYFDQQILPHLGNHISYIGDVNDQQKDQLLQNALALLMPVQWDEPFGIVMAEAMACGTPVIGFGRGAIPEVIIDGKTGFYGDTLEELCLAINKVHQLDRTLIRQKTADRFSAEVIANEYLNLYQKIIYPTSNFK